MVFLMMTFCQSLMHCHPKSITKEEQVQKDHNNAVLLEKSDRGHKDLVFFMTLFLL